MLCCTLSTGCPEWPRSHDHDPRSGTSGETGLACRRTLRTLPPGHAAWHHIRPQLCRTSIATCDPCSVEYIRPCAPWRDTSCTLACAHRGSACLGQIPLSAEFRHTFDTSCYCRDLASRAHGGMLDTLCGKHDRLAFFPRDTCEQARIPQDSSLPCRSCTSDSRSPGERTVLFGRSILSIVVIFLLSISLRM